MRLSCCRRLARVSLAVLAIAVLASPTLHRASPAVAAVQVGQLAPDFTRTDLNGVSQTLSAYRGKVVVLFLLGYG